MSRLQKNLLKAQQQMKENADKHRRDEEFAINSWVYVKLQPYRQISLSGNKYHKLAKRYYGPFLVLERIGKVAYKLSLPSHSKIHDVFHCSLLRKHEGPPPSAIDQLPPFSVDHHSLIAPLAILGSQFRFVDGKSVRFVLVQWQGLLPDDTTWENWEELTKQFDLEDKVRFEEDCIDMSKGGAKRKEAESAVEHIIVARPKRITSKPKKLGDFVLK